MGCSYESRLAADPENFSSKTGRSPGSMLAAGFEEGVCRVFHFPLFLLLIELNLLLKAITEPRFLVVVTCDTDGSVLGPE